MDRFFIFDQMFEAIAEPVGPSRFSCVFACAIVLCEDCSPKSALLSVVDLHLFAMDFPVNRRTLAALTPVAPPASASCIFACWSRSGSRTALNLPAGDQAAGSRETARRRRLLRHPISEINWNTVTSKTAKTLLADTHCASTVYVFCGSQFVPHTDGARAP